MLFLANSCMRDFPLINKKPCPYSLKIFLMTLMPPLPIMILKYVLRLLVRGQKTADVDHFNFSFSFLCMATNLILRGPVLICHTHTPKEHLHWLV